VSTGPYRPSVSLIVAIGAALACAADRRVTIGSGEDALVYKCGALKPRVESVRQIELLAHEAANVAERAVGRNEVATATSVANALRSRDFRRLEELVVGYRCEHEDSTE